MKLLQIRTTNFRALKKITLSTDKLVNVIAGPNASGKSSLLEAVRLTKTALSPRFNGEAQSALIQLGIFSPHQQVLGVKGMDINSVAHSVDRKVITSYKIYLDQNDIDIIKRSIDQLALIVLSGEMNIPAENNLAYTQFLSSETGKAKLQSTTESVSNALKFYNGGRQIDINLTMNPVNGQISGENILEQAMITILDRSLAPDKALFNYFPADRAFPVGEQAVQVGAQDMQAQLQSHMANPAAKFARLKTIVAQSLLKRSDGYEVIEKEFNTIFDFILPGKKLSEVGFNSIGNFRVLVKEDSGRVYDIDQMSSGEKGLVLTFLYMRLSTPNCGVILVDEPELHLNAAVQSRIIPFLIEKCAKPFNAQIFVCTHSAEVVRDAFDHPECNLYHLRSSVDLTPIYKQDLDPLFEVFSRLGNTAADVLSNKGNIYVEGEHDAHILQSGFGDLLAGFKVQSLGCRAEIEKEVPELQREEKANRLAKVQIFILDNDRKITSLKRSLLVRVHQLKRYCIENYLLDELILYDLIKKHSSKNNVNSRGTFPDVMEELAIAQVEEIALREIYEAFQFENPGIRTKEVRGIDLSQAVTTLAERIYRISEQVKVFNASDWINKTQTDAEKRAEELRRDWKNSWKEKCDGKRLIDDLYVRYEIGFKKVEFKKEIMSLMRQNETDDWRVLRDILSTETTSGL